MKKLSLLVLAAGLVLGGAWSVQAKPATNAIKQEMKESVAALPANRIEQLTGTVWLASKLENKISMLFGVELAIDIERMINDMMVKDNAKRGKKSPFTLSPFEKGWSKVFNKVPLKDIVARVDAWYAAHPDQEKRLVMDVIWFEIVKPELDA